MTPLLHSPFHAISMIIVLAQIIIYAIILWLSPAFGFYEAATDRPLLLVLALLLANFGLHLVSLVLFLKLPPSGQVALVICGVAVCFRAIMLFSTPIQEVDIYRYVWDGYVTTQAINPFEYAPIEILDTARESSDEDLQRLRRSISDDVGIQETLRRVHFPELPTVYPPTSQCVFALASILTPHRASIETRTMVMKGMIVAFELGAVALLLGLLRQYKIHPAWLISYAWSPLAIKEFSNSGHLDSIAICLTLATLWVLRPFSSVSIQGFGIAISGILAGLAVGAKLYPIILFPLIGIFLLKRNGFGKACLWSVGAFASIFFAFLPMFTPAGLEADSNSSLESRIASTQKTTSERLRGYSTFFSRWEMNDFLFMVLEENLRPDGMVPNQPPIWFVLTPNSVRTGIQAWASNRFEVAPDRLPFLLTRIATIAIFGTIVLFLCHRVWNTPHKLLEACFLSIAWFWFLSPTQNPWYWCWALCLIPFANSRIWLAVSGLTLLYYLRFWFLYHFTDVPILGTLYRGVAFFDFVIPWFEFGPVVLGLLVAMVLRKRYSLSTFVRTWTLGASVHALTNVATPMWFEIKQLERDGSADTYKRKT